MPQWLFEKIGNKPNPIFALQSALNWIQSLSFEISNSHGDTPFDQYSSILAQVRANGVNPLQNANRLDIGETFGSLYRGITFTMSLDTLVKSEPKAWTYPAAIVQWYYAVYNSLRAINIAQTLELTDTHAGLSKSMNNVSQFLPHPFNMLAEWQNGKNYLCTLPTTAHTAVYDLTRTFEADVQKSRGMIVQYLKGTTVFELNKIKERLKEKHGIQNFRSSSNRALRDQAAPRKINFLHCAFRYRGKANYRDAIFLSYGAADARFDGRFVTALYNIARFANLTAFGFLRVSVPGDHWQLFMADLGQNIRHLESLPAADRFWARIS